MRTVKFSEYMPWAEARRAELAAAGELPSDEELRNKGENRTEAKRELLRRADARAKAAGKTPIISYY